MGRLITFSLVLFLAFGCSTDPAVYKAKSENPEIIHRSLKKITDRIVHDIFSPPVASRIYVYSSVAAYEALVPFDSSLISLAGQLNGLEKFPQPDLSKEYCLSLVSARAMMKVGKTLTFSDKEMDAYLNELSEEYKKAGVPRSVVKRSVEYGDVIADHIIAWSSKDNYKQTRSFPKYTIVDDPATWKPTPPAYMDAVEPHWNKIRPFAMDSATQFKPLPPVPFSEKKGSPFFVIANEVYKIGINLSEEQKTIASFWDCNPFVMNVTGHVMFATKKISPGGHWMNITQVACTKAKVGLSATVEAYALVSISLAEAFISCWDEKYRSVLIRPETYINQYIDPDWVPFIQTPPFPEHTSGHSTISGSAATALTFVFGDNFSFTDSTEMEYGMTARSFSSFQQAADEAGMSRLYGGIHYRHANEVGLAYGRKVGGFVAGKVKTRKK